MRNEPLLTRDELTFLQELLDEPATETSSRLTLDSSPAINALLASLGANATLSVEALVNGQRLSFPLRLSRDEPQALQLQLDAPQIFEKGLVERPWRANLAKPLALVDRAGAASGLSVRQLSLNGALVAGDSLPSNFTLWMVLPDNSTLSLRGKQVRVIKDGLAAYRITPLQGKGLSRLKDLLVKLHNEAQAH
ncbi:MAG TPA: hypothetical protein VL178_03770 [Pseudomonas sp.]|jgi:hypothetical protein|nr:hypothetical protein [Pseudomonas sp.]